MKEYTKYWKALTYSFLEYRDLTRKSDKDIPYVIHPIRITLILRAAGLNDFEHEDIMIASLLHDLVEDTEISLNEIEEKFGEKVASIVAEVTKPEKGSKDKWLENFASASNEAKTIKMADRIDNLMDMEGMWGIEKQKGYAIQGKIILKT